MKTTPQTIILIKQFEGFAPKAYKCPAGVLTIGYGHVITSGEPRDISERQANKFLLADVEKVEAAISRLVKVALSRNQFDALVSLVFNIGIGAFSRSSLLKLLNNSDFAAAAAQFTRWVYVNKQPVTGLQNRREAEKSLFLKGI